MPVVYGVIHLQFIIPVYAAVIKSCDRFHEHVMLCLYQHWGSTIYNIKKNTLVSLHAYAG